MSDAPRPARSIRADRGDVGERLDHVLLRHLTDLPEATRARIKKCAVDWAEQVQGVQMVLGAAPKGKGMFALAQIDRLRVYVYVPQDRATRVHVGDSVDILRAEAADKPAQGRIVRSAGAIDPRTRTLQIEIQIPNASHGLLPGAYVDVALTVKSAGGLILPTNTLLFGAAGSKVAIVAADGKIRLQTVTIGTDYGHDVEIKAGLKPGDKVIINPPDSIRDGQTVAIAKVAAAAGKGG